MASSPQQQVENRRQCVFCGKPIAAQATQCPFCREMIPQMPVVRRGGSNGRREVRRGLLYMLLAGVIYYFAGGYSPLSLPVAVSSAVTTYLAPLLFLGGLGLTLYGLY